jgi:cell division protease FtsH
MLLPGTSDVSEHTQQLIDDEVRRIVEDAERETVALLGGERHRLEALARALLERETLDQPEAYEIAGVDLPTVDVAAQATASEPASR